MASIGAFNQTLSEFLTDLGETFPEENAIRINRLKFEAGIKANARMALDAVMPDLAKNASKISARDETLFSECSNVIPDIDMHKLWNSDISDNTRSTIWDYLNTLLMLGTTINTIPNEMLGQIEQIAQSCVNQMSENPQQQDVFMQAQQALFQNGMFANMLGNMSGAGNADANVPAALPYQPGSNNKSGKKTNRKR